MKTAKMIRRSILAATVAVLAPTAAGAATYDVFSAFDGTATGKPGSGFTFGYTASGPFSGTLTSFDRFATSGCDGDAKIACAQRSDIGAVGVYKATTATGAYDPSNSSVLEAGELNFHPGTNGANAGFQFSVVGAFDYVIGISSNDTFGAHSIDYRLFQGTTLLGSGIVGANPVTLSGISTLVAGSPITLLIGANGDFRYDSTGITATFTDRPIVIDPVPGAVPEPATWAMMLAGFAMVGTAMRVRTRRIRYA